ncbi:hypothetical protein HMPREF9135_1488 [Segatella baroniae F0067]|uniref:Uncharacterized protein n=1 Tax=Segatella baroniae F0067 TaxID=1115809 RepID=U2P2W7_9BACT|nr:hypothetical protein HMPREF9135_1488 [Segatella baroniae F0067]
MNKNELGNTDKTTWTYRLPSFLPSGFLPTLQNHHVFQAKGLCVLRLSRRAN